MKRSRVVLDTSLVVSRMLKPLGASSRAFHRALERSIVLASIETLRELEEVFARKKFDLFTTVAERQTILDEYQFAISLCLVVETVADCRDAKDNKFLESALSGGAEMSITGDEDLLCLHPWRGISIVSPSAYLAL